VTEIRIDQADLAHLYADALDAPPIIREELTKGIRRAGERVKRAVQRGFSWSHRIPALVQLDVRGSAASPTARIVIDDPKGEAQAINHRDRAGTFRHPVFGGGHATRKDWTWVSQTARPSFRTSAEPEAEAAEDEIAQAMDEAARRLGFH
jgi:DNA topoisomerase VI subunit B